MYVLEVHKVTNGAFHEREDFEGIRYYHIAKAKKFHCAFRPSEESFAAVFDSVLPNACQHFFGYYFCGSRTVYATTPYGCIICTVRMDMIYVNHACTQN